MSEYLAEMTVGIDVSVVKPESPNYRVPTWPPSPDWPVVIDKNGTVTSRWGDSTWNLTPWTGRAMSLNFGDGQLRKGRQAEPLDAENANTLRLVATWLIWGPQSVRATLTVRTHFCLLRPIFVFCIQNRISATTLMRFPNLLEQLPRIIRTSNYVSVIALLQRLYDAREFLGFTIVDQRGLKQLSSAASSFNHVQTPYIPPRIWFYQLARLRECLVDFREHQAQIEACYHFCLDAYAKKARWLEASPAPTWHRRSPFSVDFSNQKDYPGRFHDVAVRFGIAEILTKWVKNYERISDARTFSDYFSVVTFAGLAYISNFTLQRKEEISSLRSNCLHWEDDKLLGRVPIICGETTKTAQDADARWIASPSVEIAVQTLSFIAHLRGISGVGNPIIRSAKADDADPYLLSSATEPWGRALANSNPYALRTVTRDFKTMLKSIGPMLFDPEIMKITSHDLEIAQRLTPNLPEDEFAIGKIWPLAWHQYRRTGAVNMFASGEISDQTMQHQLKHSSHLMPL